MRLKLIFNSIIICGITIALTCCKEVIDTPTVIDIGINLWIKDENGKNLLDSTNTNYYKAAEIRIFNLVNGIKTEVFNSGMQAPRNFLIYKNEGNGEYFMKLYPYEGIGKAYENGTRIETTTTYIQWRESLTDTVVCTITRIQNSMYCTKVYYNGILKYDDKTNKDLSWGEGIFHRFIEITE